MDAYVAFISKNIFESHSEECTNTHILILKCLHWTQIWTNPSCLKT